jgi:hypothetical protein
MSSEYHKIDTVFKRDPATNHKSLLVGQYSRPEFEYLADNDWVWTEKVDGTNIRVIVDPGVVDVQAIRFGGKTDNAQIPAQLVARLEERFLPQRAALLDVFSPSGVVLYGEGYGAKIQSGGVYRSDQDFILFDVRVGSWWLERSSVEEIAGKFGLDVVPIVGRGTLHEMVQAVEDGYHSQWGAFAAEGIVARPAMELKARNGDRIITKLKHKDFAISNKGR